MVQFVRFKIPSFQALFYIVLVSETLWFGLMLDPVIQTGSQIRLARINETNVYNVAAEHETLRFLMIEYCLGIFSLVLQILCIIALSVGHHRKCPKCILFYVVWCVMFHIVIIPVYIIYMLVYINGLPKPSEDPRYALYRNNKEQLAQLDFYAEYQVMSYNKIFIPLLVIEFLWSLFCLFIAFRGVLAYRKEGPILGVENPNLDLDSSTEADSSVPNGGDYNRFR